MGRSKSKKVKQAASWCWYCDREFEDDKILISHQKAKHFRCPHCPRRLNTAGGLAVHIDQVHKLSPDRIDNALPGRESFDFEIYGMEGVPTDDLNAWKDARNERLGIKPREERPKRPRAWLIALTEDEARKQLAAHRALMYGAPPPAPEQPAPPLGFGMAIGHAQGSGPFPIGIPPPPGGFAALGGALPPPPPGFKPPPGMAFPAPPPGFQLPPGIPPPPGGLFPPNIPPPPGGFAALAALGIPPPPPGFNPAMFGASPLPPAPISGAGTPLAPALAQANVAAMVREEVESSSVVLKPGTLLVYGDNEVSPEEKRAKLLKYAVPKEGATEGTDAGGSNKRPRAEEMME